MEVVCTGRMTTYAGRSKYQLVIEAVELAGIGALLKLLEERRKKLAAEGLFDESRKRPLPYLPEVIGVVTSPTGAVIRDILHRLADRFPRRVLVWPVPVQGESAGDGNRGGDRGLQRARARRRRAAARSADRGARRRQPRGSDGLQRGGGGARRRRLDNPADLGRRPRDRHHADRFRLRPARADADAPPPRWRCRCGSTWWPRCNRTLLRLANALARFLEERRVRVTGLGARLAGPALASGKRAATPRRPRRAPGLGTGPAAAARPRAARPSARAFEPGLRAIPASNACCGSKPWRAGSKAIACRMTTS